MLRNIIQCFTNHFHENFNYLINENKIIACQFFLFYAIKYLICCIKRQEQIP